MLIIKRAIMETNVLKLIQGKLARVIIIMGSAASTLYLVLMAAGFFKGIGLSASYIETMALVMIANYAFVLSMIVLPRMTTKDLVRTKRNKDFEMEVMFVGSMLFAIVCYVVFFVWTIANLI